MVFPEVRGVRVVPLEDTAHKEGALDLFRKIFGQRKASWLERRYEWQYGESPARRPDQPASFVMIKEERVVGHFGIIHVMMQVDGRVIQGCWSTDLFVDASQRRSRGMLQLLACPDISADLPMGYGTIDQVERIYLRRGYLRIGAESHQLRLLNQPAALRLQASRGGFGGRAARFASRLQNRARNLARYRAQRPIEIPAEARRFAPPEVTDRPPEDIEDLWQAIVSDYPIAAVRDEVHLSWRYDPSFAPALFLTLREAGRLAACAVLEAFTWRGLQVGQLSELLIHRRDAGSVLPLLLQEAIELSQRSGLEALISEGFPADIRRTLHECGLSDLANRREVLVARDNRGQFSAPLLGDRSNWLVSAGDSDRSTAYPRVAWKR